MDVDELGTEPCLGLGWFRNSPWTRFTFRRSTSNEGESPSMSSEFIYSHGICIPVPHFLLMMLWFWCPGAGWRMLNVGGNQEFS